MAAREEVKKEKKSRPFFLKCEAIRSSRMVSLLERSSRLYVYAYICNLYVYELRRRFYLHFL